MFALVRPTQNIGKKGSAFIPSFFFFFWHSSLHFQLLKLKSEYIVTVPKGILSRSNGIQSPSNTWMKPILRLCMPKNAHTYTLLKIQYLNKTAYLCTLPSSKQLKPLCFLYSVLWENSTILIFYLATDWLYRFQLSAFIVSYLKIARMCFM